MFEYFRENPQRSAVILTGLLMFFGFVYGANKHGIENFYEANFGELAVAMGTYLLALFTFDLVHTEIEESRTARKLSRIKEQMKEFYSPLIGIMTEKEEDEFRDVLNMPLVKGNYTFLASEELREKLVEYFKNLRYRDSVFLRDLRLKVGSEDTEKYVSDKLSNIRDTINEDFTILIEKYNENEKIIVIAKALISYNLQTMRTDRS